MTNNVLQSFTDVGKGSYEKFQQWHDLNCKTLEKLTTLQFSLLALGVENAVQHTRVLSEVDDYANLLTTETEIANDYRDKLTTLTQEAGECLAQSHNEYLNFAGQYFSVEQNQAQKTATTAGKRKRTKKQGSVKKAA